LKDARVGKRSIVSGADDREDTAFAEIWTAE